MLFPQHNFDHRLAPSTSTTRSCRDPVEAGTVNRGTPIEPFVASRYAGRTGIVERLARRREGARA
ncbi:hypothetical protein [Rhodococcus sp. NPDC059234]|uniref:hypothetical protein n=1 Tax=Rhodococcus sp. NPDC059234 TaxID=3346781 RepID=UPI00367082ED